MRKSNAESNIVLLKNRKYKSNAKTKLNGQRRKSLKSEKSNQTKPNQTD